MSSKHSQSRELRNSTTQAISILGDTRSAVERVLEKIDSRNAGYVQLREVFDQIQKDIRDAQERASNQTIRLGILGGRGSGKSTLANALIGAPLLPDSAIIFCTSLPTAIRYSRPSLLHVVSDEPEYNIDSAVGLSLEEIRDILNSICKESENPDNEKRITEVVVGVSERSLYGKEIVDVPGFTKGNPLHQAFAEKYAKHYCDICLVMINNAESVEINKEQGIEALLKTFQDRIDTTIFIINKCDDCSASDLKYIHNKINRFFHNEKPTIFNIAAKNAVRKEGNQFEFPDLQSYLSFLSAERCLFLTHALLTRLKSNFLHLKQLCQLTASELKQIESSISALLNKGLDARLKQLKQQLKKEHVVTGELPKIEIDLFNLPSNPIGRTPTEYTYELVDRIRAQSDRLDQMIQQEQASIYQNFNDHFDAAIASFNEDIQKEVQVFQAKFGITESIRSPEHHFNYEMLKFDPSKIEYLKPLPFRLWVEKKLPAFLVREIRFWQSPMSVGLDQVGMSVPIQLPFQLVELGETLLKVHRDVPESALKTINIYIVESLTKFADDLDRRYAATIDKLVEDWKTCLRQYLDQVQVAIKVTAPDTLAEIDNFMVTLRENHNRVTILLRDI